MLKYNNILIMHMQRIMENMEIEILSDTVCVKKNRSDCYISPIRDEDAAEEWASHAYEIIRSSTEMERRHSMIDDLIEKVQLAYYNVTSLIREMTPHRKAYSFFFEEKRPLVELVHKKRDSNRKFEIARKVARWWKIISPVEKTKYLDLELEALQQYNQKYFYHLTKQVQLTNLIDWIELNRIFISSWPSDLLESWAKMVMSKF